jgi:hypothetical protein
VGAVWSFMQRHQSFCVTVTFGTKRNASQSSAYQLCRVLGLTETMNTPIGEKQHGTWNMMIDMMWQSDLGTSLWSLAIIGPRQPWVATILRPTGHWPDTKTSACCHVPLLAKEPCKLCDHQPWATRYSSISVCGESKKHQWILPRMGQNQQLMNRGCANLNENWWTPPQSLVTVHWSGTGMIEKETIIWVWLSSIMILRTSKDPTMFLNFLHHCLKETEPMVDKPIVILNLMWLLCYAMAY